MVADLIGVAKQKQAANQAEIKRLTEENSRLDIFLQTAKTLEDSLSPGNLPTKSSANGDGKVKIQVSSLAGRAVKILLAKGSASLGELAAELSEKPGATKDELISFRNNVNSALWRRKDDVFERKADGRYYLRPRKENIELVE